MNDYRGVVNYLIEKSDFSLTNLKLQKLLYFVYGVYLALHGHRPFNDRPQAWQYGPVFPKVYHQLKAHGSRPVSLRLASASDLDDDIKKVADKVYDLYGTMPESQLVRVTHKPNSPWAQNYDRHTRGIVIPDETIADYFKKNVVRSRCSPPAVFSAPCHG